MRKELRVAGETKCLFIPFMEDAGSRHEPCSQRDPTSERIHECTVECVLSIKRQRLPAQNAGSWLGLSD